jgi:mono/diheme cytochrome c family protein
MRIPTQQIFGGLFAVGACALALSACQPSTSSQYTFPEGDAAAGQVVFVELGCVSCHTVTGVPALRDGMDRAERTIPLGGEQTRVVTYGELVTAIVNPSHEVSQTRLGTMVQRNGETLMRNYNDLMTVTQLTDLVTFLEQHYTLRPFDRTNYRSYAPLQ